MGKDSVGVNIMQELSKVLIVEDSKTQQIKLQLLLESAGFAVEIASDGREAIEYLQNNKNSLPDLVITDIVMPEMDGIELTSIIRDNFENVPVIILTSENNEETLVKVFQAGAVDYLIKPFSQTELTVRIKNTLELFHKNWETSQIFNSAPIGMRMISKDFVITRVNDTMCTILGIKREDMIGRKCHEFFCLNSAYKKNGSATDVCENGHCSLEGEIEYTRPDGTKVSGIVTQAPTYNKNGKLIGIVESFKDLTEWKKAETALQALQHQRSIGFLAGGIAHDFNNILTSIYGNLELAKLNIPEDAPGRKYIENSEKSLSRAKDLTQRLISFAHGDSFKKEIVDISPVVSEVLDFALSGSEIKHVLEIEDNLHKVEVDPNQIQRVLTNLFVNAIEASEANAVLRVYVNNRTVHENEFPDIPPGDYVELTVEDEGCGMNSDELSHVFTPYFSTKNAGRGFGLAICYSIINKHNGHIRVESELGKGTTFTILLPKVAELAEAEVKSEHLPEKKEATKPEELSVLLMDDEEMILEIMSEFLGVFGCSVTQSRDGEEALKYYMESMENGNPFDLVILDLTIPGGMGGKIVVKEILKINPDAKCIVSSGYSDDDIMSNFSKYGFTDAVPKPYTLDNVKSALDRVLKGE